ncbi:MAG: hypothetical protein CMF59_17460 [Leptospiraceae bacterium]|nr:hypothetical protein [Leptospiraceae bacterium]
MAGRKKSMIRSEHLTDSGARLSSASSPLVESFSGASTDTRKVQPGEIFFCLKGPNFDAHDFASVALEKGATGIVIEQGREDDVTASLAESEPAWAQRMALYLCEDPLKTMQDVARLHRRDQSYTVIAVTGSNGKTSAKEMLLGMLSELLGQSSVDATVGNLNNHIGVPLTLLNLKPGISHAIIEMGMNHAGEIDLLSSIAEPDHGLITSVGRAHIEFFYSKRGIARAKQELMQYCKTSLCYPASAIGKTYLLRKSKDTNSRGKPAIALFGMADDPGWEAVPVRVRKQGLWKSLKGRDLQFGPSGLEFSLESEDFQGKVINQHYYSRVQAENLLGCIATLNMAGFPLQSVQEAARHAAPVSGGRFHILRKENRILVDDTYNANPDSFLAAIRSLRKMLPEGKLLCLAGQMAELGSAGAAGHFEIGQILKEDSYEIQAVGTDGARKYLEGFGKDLERMSEPGEHYRFFFPDSAELADHIERNSQYYLSFDGILVKGSRSARMEQACEALKRIGYV